MVLEWDTVMSRMIIWSTASLLFAIYFRVYQCLNLCGKFCYLDNLNTGIIDLISRIASVAYIAVISYVILEVLSDVSRSVLWQYQWLKALDHE